MKSIIGLTALIALMAVCNLAIDESPTSVTSAPSADVPPAVAGSVSPVFPNAKDISFSGLKVGQVWAATLQMDARYATTLDVKGDFYTTFRQIDERSLPVPSHKAIPSGRTIQKAHEYLSEQKAIKGYVTIVADAKWSTSIYQFTTRRQRQNAVSASTMTLPRDNIFTAPLFSGALTASDLCEAIKTYRHKHLPTTQSARRLC